MKLLPEQGIPYQDAAEEALTGAAALAWQQLTSAFPETGISLNRLLATQSADQLGALIDSARNASGVEPPDLLNLMAIDVDGNSRCGRVAGRRQGPSIVDFAYDESPLIPASVDPSDDTLATSQGYLNVAPVGIEAFFAWSLPGADGASVRFLDIERGWDLTHEDLAGGSVVPLNQSVPGNEFHSTACLGIVLAKDNAKGVIGIAPKVQGAIASSLQPSLADAFALAVGFLQAGDVLLIEEQTGDGKPVEMDPHLALLILTLTLLGIVVIEPAGNGLGGSGHDLDLLLRPDGTSLDRNTPIFFNSGAIMVGARHALLNRSRMQFSCFGNRVDCHAWGEGIVTTSSIIGLFGPYAGLNPLGGDTGFGGTSGASAIIAGAAIVLQGIARARGTPFTPTRMRALLSGSFNTPSNDPSVDRIGVMPNLKEAADQI